MLPGFTCFSPPSSSPQPCSDSSRSLPCSSSSVAGTCCPPHLPDFSFPSPLCVMGKEAFSSLQQRDSTGCCCCCCCHNLKDNSRGDRQRERGRQAGRQASGPVCHESSGSFRRSPRQAPLPSEEGALQGAKRGPPEQSKTPPPPNTQTKGREMQTWACQDLDL